MLRRSTLLCLVIFTCSAFSSAQQPHSKCTAPEYHQLDFWVGDWDVFEQGSSAPVAHVRVDRILDGCVLHERYEDLTGHRGESFSMYDSGQRKWRQSWYTNDGKNLELLGEKQGDSIVLTATDYDSTKQSIVRGTWKPIGDSVQETAVRSSDGGKTWQPWFDLTFRPAKSHSADQQAIIDLDRQYQAAVQRNDAASMDRLLADDFLLMSSSGKSYTKHDLLEEARSGKIVYESQDDRDPVVHLWGDAAIITATLHAKGSDAGTPFDYTLTFSDLYLKTPNGWRYTFGQAACRKP